MDKAKILVFTMPGSGHLNPLFPILKELIKTQHVDLVVYLSEEYKQQVESMGARFRPIINNFTEFKGIDRDPTKSDGIVEIFKMMQSFLSLSADNTVYLANEIEKEKPDVIMYDCFCMYAKWTFKYYTRCYEMSRNLSESSLKKLKFVPTRPLPDVVVFSPSFAVNRPIYPNKFENEYLPKTKFSLSLVWNFIKLFLKNLRLCYRLGLNMSLLEISPMSHPNIIKKFIVTVIPELQPRSHLFDQNVYKFVGSTVDDSLIDARINDDLFRNLLSIFPIRNELALLGQQSDDSILVFASLGTVFNDVISVYKSIVDAFKEFDNESSVYRHSTIRLKNLRVVISTGEKIYKKFENLTATENYQIPENITLVKSAPQIDILKRASLFITHCGMNSTSEAVHLGVPMICVPIGADQPLVAYRIIDELGFGIRLNQETLKPTEIRRAAHKILGDRSYYDRIKRYSNISREYNGAKNSCNLLVDLSMKKNL